MKQETVNGEVVTYREIRDSGGKITFEQERPPDIDKKVHQQFADDAALAYVLGIQLPLSPRKQSED